MINSGKKKFDNTPEQIKVRSKKREKFIKNNIDPYPAKVERTHTITQICQQYVNLDKDYDTQDIVSIVGRIVFLRNGGKLCFSSLQEGNGSRIQIMLNLKVLGIVLLSSWKSDIDLGDFVSITGNVVTSKSGELSIMAHNWKMVSKSLRPLPTFHKQLSEETRIRKRYIDLIVNKQSRKMVTIRSKVLSSLRNTLENDAFIEIETPMLHPIQGGATAEPFTTHLNAYDIDVFLRIAPELYIKRALIGGIEKVFEINRNFRNEGVDSTHSPEFSAIEVYQAYSDYKSIAQLTKKMIINAVKHATGNTIISLSNGLSFELNDQWKEISLYDSLSEKLDTSINPDTNTDKLIKIANKYNINIKNIALNEKGKLVEKIWEDIIGNNLYEPTFVFDFPVETSPLVREHRDKPNIVEKWDLYINGFELGTGYSELVDPIVQRKRFEYQISCSKSTSLKLDEDFLQAMEYGMPPTGGMGMGIDRLLMIITNCNIRETILFPFIK